jgi:nucleoside-diphosphate-sugar epimerase
VPRVLERARQGRLRIVGDGHNCVDMVHIENAVDCHLLAESALRGSDGTTPPAGRAYFVTNGEPVILWQWINQLVVAAGLPPVKKSVSLASASAIGACCEAAWRMLPLKGEPPMTRFIAAELAKDHWFDIRAARRDLGYNPRISMSVGTGELIVDLKRRNQ